MRWGDAILDFVGLRAKAYAYTQETYDKKEKKWLIADNKKLKGINKGVVKKKIHFKHYKDCLFTGEDHYESMVTFRSKLHNYSGQAQEISSKNHYNSSKHKGMLYFIM